MVLNIFKNSYFQTVVSSYFPFFLKEEGINCVYQDSMSEKIIINYDIPEDAKNIAVIIHGWFGSYSSPIVKKYALLFKRKGYGIIRINLKDHGNTAALNKSIFSFSDIYYIEEIINYLSVKTSKKLVLLGLSFGANILIRTNYNKIKERVICLILITPVFDIKNALICIDNKKLFKHVFYLKWKNMLKDKQEKFPLLFDFSLCFKQYSCLSILKYLLPYYEFNSLDEYFESCTIKNEHIESLRIPTLFVLSENDPIISVNNIKYLNTSILLNKRVNIEKNKYGGHCLFRENILNYVEKYDR